MCKSVANLQTLHCIMETKTTTANKVKNSNRVNWGFVRSFKVKTNILFTVLLLFSGIVFSSCEKVENDSMEIKVLDESRLAKSASDLQELNGVGVQTTSRIVWGILEQKQEMLRTWVLGWVLLGGMKYLIFLWIISLEIRISYYSLLGLMALNIQQVMLELLLHRNEMVIPFM